MSFISESSRKFTPQHCHIICFFIWLSWPFLKSSDNLPVNASCLQKLVKHFCVMNDWINCKRQYWWGQKKVWQLLHLEVSLETNSPKKKPKVTYKEQLSMLEVNMLTSENAHNSCILEKWWKSQYSNKIQRNTNEDGFSLIVL